jgi:hypothetical protein
VVNFRLSKHHFAGQFSVIKITIHPAPLRCGVDWHTCSCEEKIEEEKVDFIRENDKGRFRAAFIIHLSIPLKMILSTISILK